MTDHLPDASKMAARLHAQRSKSLPSSIEDCRRDVEEALLIAGGTVPSFVTGVRIAGERVGRVASSTLFAESKRLK